MNESRDADLVTLCVEHADGQAFSELYRRHYRKALAAASAVSPAVSEDAVQEATVRALGGLGQLRDRSAFGPWFAQIARREALRAVTRREAIPVEDALLDNHDPRSGPEARAVETLDLTAALGRLDPRTRNALVEQHVMDREISDIAGEMGLRTSSFKVMTSRGRGALRDLMRASGLATVLVRIRRGLESGAAAPTMMAAAVLPIAAIMSLARPALGGSEGMERGGGGATDGSHLSTSRSSAEEQAADEGPWGTPLRPAEGDSNDSSESWIVPEMRAGPAAVTSEQPEDAEPNHEVTVVLPTGHEVTVEARLPIDPGGGGSPSAEGRAPLGPEG